MADIVFMDHGGTPSESVQEYSGGRVQVTPNARKVAEVIGTRLRHCGFCVNQNIDVAVEETQLVVTFHPDDKQERDTLRSGVGIGFLQHAKRIAARYVERWAAEAHCDTQYTLTPISVNYIRITLLPKTLLVY